MKFEWEKSCILWKNQYKSMISFLLNSFGVLISLILTISYHHRISIVILYKSLYKMCFFLFFRHSFIKKVFQIFLQKVCIKRWCLIRWVSVRTEKECFIIKLSCSKEICMAVLYITFHLYVFPTLLLGNGLME